MITAPIRSMTGFGESGRDLASGRLTVAVRTVNHRFLNVQIRTPSGSERHQAALERVLRGAFARGHVTVQVSVERSVGGEGDPPAVGVDLERARGYVLGMRRLRDELGLEGDVSLEMFPYFRDVFREPEAREPLPDLPVEVLEDAVREAAAQAVRMREQEGERLAADLSGCLDRMEALVGRVEEDAPARLLAEHERMREAVGRLLGDDSRVDEERIAREIAHLAERLDVNEELVRFRSHLAMFRDTLHAGDEGGVGKRFGFIAQEMLREANTIGSKANDAGIARHVVLLKEEIERLREQVENVE